MNSVGICLSGHARNFSCVPYFLNLRDILHKNGISTFFYISTWDIDGYRIGLFEQSKNQLDLGTNLLKTFNAEAIEIENHSSLLIQSEVENLARKFQQVIIDARPHIVFDHPHETKTNILHMFRKAQRSFDMVGVSHDVLIRGRLDILFDEETVASQVIDMIQQKSDTIVVPSNFSFGGEHHAGGGRMCDSFAVGSFKSMKTYFRTYDSMIDGKIAPEYLTKNGIWFCPHSILRHNLLMNGVVYREVDIGYDINRETK